MKPFAHPLVSLQYDTYKELLAATGLVNIKTGDRVVCTNTDLYTGEHLKIFREYVVEKVSKNGKYLKLLDLPGNFKASRFDISKSYEQLSNYNSICQVFNATVKSQCYYISFTGNIYYTYTNSSNKIVIRNLRNSMRTNLEVFNSPLFLIDNTFQEIDFSLPVSVQVKNYRYDLLRTNPDKIGEYSDVLTSDELPSGQYYFSLCDNVFSNIDYGICHSGELPLVMSNSLHVSDNKQSVALRYVDPQSGEAFYTYCPFLYELKVKGTKSTLKLEKGCGVKMKIDDPKQPSKLRKGMKGEVLKVVADNYVVIEIGDETFTTLYKYLKVEEKNVSA